MQIGPKDPQEVKTVIFDFTNQLGANTISTATVAVEILKGTDAAAAAMVSGTLAISGPLVRQKVANGVLGASYKFTCVATDSAGEKHLVAAELDIARG